MMNFVLVLAIVGKRRYLRTGDLMGLRRKFRIVSFVVAFRIWCITFDTSGVILRFRDNMLSMRIMALKDISNLVVGQIHSFG